MLREALVVAGKVGIFAGVIMGAMEIFLSRGLNEVVGTFLKNNREKALVYNPKQHLDKLETRDRLYIGINKVQTVFFVYHMLLALWHFDHIKWSVHDISIYNTVGSLVAFFLLYDLFYAPFHRLLHARWLYKYVHKHHHRQISPTRGNYDAINVHPFEFFVGEYIHLLVVAIVPCHLAAVFAFVLSGGLLASLNHTRLAFSLPWGIYDVRNHDIHHRWPDNNFGQYIMLIDSLCGWYRPYDPPLMPQSKKLQ